MNNENSDKNTLLNRRNFLAVGGKTILPNAQVWEYGQPVSTSVDKWQ